MVRLVLLALLARPLLWDPLDLWDLSVHLLRLLLSDRSVLWGLVYLEVPANLAGLLVL